MDANEVFPVYRLIGGLIQRQDLARGRWTPLTPDEARRLLSLLDGHAPQPAARGDLFHHPV